jgi:hypothetical protein
MKTSHGVGSQRRAGLYSNEGAASTKVRNEANLPPGEKRVKQCRLGREWLPALITNACYFGEARFRRQGPEVHCEALEKRY